MRYLLKSSPLIVVLLVSCVSTTMFVNKKYRYDSDLACISLFPLTKDVVHIANLKDVHDDFKEDYRPEVDIIADSGYTYMYKTFRDSTKKRIKKVAMKSEGCDNWTQDGARYFKYEKKIGRDSVLMSFDVPKTEFLQSLETEANVLFIINSVEITRTKASTGTANRMFMGGSWVATGGSGSMPTFKADVRYIVWDYVKNEAVSCGTFSVQAAIFFAATKGTWRKLFGSISHVMVKKTPFKRRTS